MSYQSREFNDYDVNLARALDNAKKRLNRLVNLPGNHPEKDDEEIQALREFIAENED